MNRSSFECQGLPCMLKAFGVATCRASLFASRVLWRCMYAQSSRVSNSKPGWSELCSMTYRDIKTRTERAGPPAFTTIVEMVTPAALRIYNQAGQAVDALLRGEAPCSELRTRCQDGRIKVQYERPAAGGSMGAGSSILGTLIASILGRQ